MLLGLEINGDNAKLADALRDNKLLTIPASNNVIRIIPPLIITKKEIKLALQIIEKTLQNFS